MRSWFLGGGTKNSYLCSCGGIGSTAGSCCLTGAGGGGGAVDVEGSGGSGKVGWARADEENGRSSDHETTLTGVVEEVDGGQQRSVIARWNR